MDFFKRHPFVRFIIPLILGILVQFYGNLPGVRLYYGLAAMCLVFFVLAAFWLPYNWHYLKGLVLTLFLFFLGLVLVFQKQNANHLSTTAGQEIYLAGMIQEMPKETEKTYRVAIEVFAQKVESSWKTEQANIWIFIEKDSLAAQLKAGQQIVFKIKVPELNQPGNPFGFDFNRYLEIKQVAFSAFVPAGDWQMYSEQISGLRQKALNVRASIIELFRQGGIEGDALAVLSALTLGYKNEMESQVRNAYAGAGASHILAVSGMHVGILYLVFMFLFGWMKILGKWSRLKYLFIMLLLWAYAFLTGLSPSVCRASTMFSFLLFGYFMHKRVNIYNSLAASAFLLFVANPFLLFDIGFQLSYTAVAGIVFFQPRIYKLFYIKNKALDWLWQITAVSIAAQLVTSPITLYYFHQFPLYFWLSNFVVILGATALLYGALLILVLSKIPMVVSALGFVLKNIVVSMNTFVQWVNTLPGAVITDIPMQKWIMILLYLLLISTTAWIITRKYKFLIAILIMLFIWSIQHSIFKFGQKLQHQVCVYQVRQNAAIQFVWGEQSWWFFADSITDKSEQVIKDANRYWNTRQNHYLVLLDMDTTIQSGPFLYHSGFWKLGDTSGLLLNNQTINYMQGIDSVFLDVLIVSGNTRVPVSSVLKGMHFNQLVVDGSVPVWHQESWCKSSLTQSIHCVRKQGAYLGS